MTYRPFAIKVEYCGIVYEGKVVPIVNAKETNSLPKEFAVTLNNIFRGVFAYNNHAWESTSLEDEPIVVAIGDRIKDWYE